MKPHRFWMMLVLLGPTFTIASISDWTKHSSLYFSEDEKEEQILQAMERVELYSEYDDEYDPQNNGSSSQEVEDTALQSPDTPPLAVDESKPQTSEVPKASSKEDVPKLETISIPSPSLPTTLDKPIQYLTLPDRFRMKLPKEKNKQASITSPWVRNFLNKHHRDVLLPLPRDFCADTFNLAHLPTIVEKVTGNGSLYKQALKLLTESDPVEMELSDDIDQAAVILYYHLHQRYAVSPRGLDMVRRRFLNKTDPIFGRCPKLSCHGMPMLPIGESDSYSEHRSLARRYCVNCNSVFYHWDSSVDGCVWGTSFPHLFLMVHGQEVFHWTPKQRRHKEHHYTPRIFGFRLHHTAVQ